MCLRLECKLRKDIDSGFTAFGHDIDMLQTYDLLATLCLRFGSDEDHC